MLASVAAVPIEYLVGIPAVFAEVGGIVLSFSPAPRITGAILRRGELARCASELDRSSSFGDLANDNDTERVVRHRPILSSRRRCRGGCAYPRFARGLSFVNAVDRGDARARGAGIRVGSRTVAAGPSLVVEIGPGWHGSVEVFVTPPNGARSRVCRSLGLPANCVPHGWYAGAGGYTFEVLFVQATQEALATELRLLRRSGFLADNGRERALDRAAGTPELDLVPLEANWWIIQGSGQYCTLVRAGELLGGDVPDGLKSVASRFASAPSPSFVIVDLASLERDVSLTRIVGFDGGDEPRMVWMRDSVESIRQDGWDAELMDMPADEHERFKASLEIELAELAIQLDPSIEGPYELADSLGALLPDYLRG